MPSFPARGTPLPGRAASWLVRAGIPATVVVVALGVWQTAIAESLEVGPDPAACAPLARGTTGLVRLAFARTEACAQALVETWRAHDVAAAATRSLLIDFPFLLAYAVAIAGLALRVAARPRVPRWQTRVLRWIPAIAVVAAACDALENLGLLRLLDLSPFGPPLLATYGLAAAKFGLLGVALFVATAAWVAAESREAIVDTTSPAATDGHDRPGPRRWGWAIYAWPLRVPILASAFLIVLPLLILLPDVGRYLSGLFDPLEEAAVLPIGLLALLCAWTVAIISRLVLAYGADRFTLPRLHGTGRGDVEPHIWAWSASLAVPSVTAVLWHSHRASDSSIGAMTLYAGMGAILALLLLALVLALSRWVRGPQVGRRRVYQALLDLVARHPFLASGFVERPQPGAPVALRPGHGIAAFLALASLGTYVAVGWWTANVGRPVFASTLAFVLLLTLLLTWLYGFLAFLLDRTRVPLLVFLLLWVAIVHFVINRIVTTDVEYETYDVSRAPAVAAMTAGTPRPIVVAASGGGIQAAAWTTRVLTGLADDAAGFEERVRLVSAVSGGSVGAMHYLTQQASCSPGDTAAQATPRGMALAHAMESSLHAAGWGLVYQDLPRTVVPWFTSPLVNRGSLLEDAWKRDRRLASSVDAQQPGSSPALLSNWGMQVANGRCPGMVFNAMVAETGEPLLFSTATLPPSLERFAFARHYPGLDVRLTTAARLSAAFPYVSPAAHAAHDRQRPARGYRHVVDGGYFDNFGVATAAEWLNAELLALERTNQLPARVLLIEICEEGTCSSSTPDATPAPGGPQRSLPYQLYAPLSALYQVRGAAQRARNRWHVSLLRQRWAAKVCVDRAIFAYPLRAGPMSWHLSEHEKGEVRQSWDHGTIRRERDVVLRFLAGADEPAICQATR